MLFFSCPLSHAEIPLCRVGVTTGNVVVTISCILITFFGVGTKPNTYIPPNTKSRDWRDDSMVERIGFSSRGFACLQTPT